MSVAYEALKDKDALTIWIIDMRIIAVLKKSLSDQTSLIQKILTTWLRSISTETLKYMYRRIPSDQDRDAGLRSIDDNFYFSSHTTNEKIMWFLWKDNSSNASYVSSSNSNAALAVCIPQEHL